MNGLARHCPVQIDRDLWDDSRFDGGPSSLRASLLVDRVLGWLLATSSLRVQGRRETRD
jgi:hypothetical protein